MQLEKLCLLLHHEIKPKQKLTFYRIMADKLRRIVSYEKMSEELAEAFKEKYPKGEIDFLPELQKYPKPDGSCFYAVTVEIPTAIYLVKIEVETDNVEDIEKWLDAGPDDEGGDEEGSDNIPDSGDCPGGAPMDDQDDDL